MTLTLCRWELRIALPSTFLVVDVRQSHEAKRLLLVLIRPPRQHRALLDSSPQQDTCALSSWTPLTLVSSLLMERKYIYVPSKTGSLQLQGESTDTSFQDLWQAAHPRWQRTQSHCE